MACLFRWDQNNGMWDLNRIKKYLAEGVLEEISPAELALII